MNRRIPAVFGTLALASGALAAAPAAAEEREVTFDVGALEWVLHVDDLGFGGYISAIEVRSGGKTVLTVDQADGMIYGDELPADMLLAPAGTDVTGDGRGDVLLELFSGGAHCCFTVYHFSLDPPELRATVFGGHSPVEAVDAGGDGRLRLRLNDWVLAYWRTSFAESPAEEVVLRWDTYGGWMLDTDLQRRPAPSRAELETLIGYARDGFDDQGEPTPQLWGPMMTLLYGGNFTAMTTLLDTVWRGDRAGRDAFLAGFMGQIGQSPYWPGLAELNGL